MCRWTVFTCFRNSNGWLRRVLSIRRHISSLLIKLALLQRLFLMHCSEQDVNESDLLSQKGVSSRRIELFAISKTACSDSWDLVVVAWRSKKIAMASICWQIWKDRSVAETWSHRTNYFLKKFSSHWLGDFSRLWEWH